MFIQHCDPLPSLYKDVWEIRTVLYLRRADKVSETLLCFNECKHKVEAPYYWAQQFNQLFNAIYDHGQGD